MIRIRLNFFIVSILNLFLKIYAYSNILILNTLNHNQDFKRKNIDKLLIRHNNLVRCWYKLQYDIEI